MPSIIPSTLETVVQTHVLRKDLEICFSKHIAIINYIPLYTRPHPSFINSDNYLYWEREVGPEMEMSSCKDMLDQLEASV